jgi:urea transport system substrate-binding protein
MRRSRRQIVWLAFAGLAITIAVVAGAASASSSHGGQLAAGSPIKIGVVTSLSGPAGIYGPPVRNTVQLAIKQINAKGGVLGRPLKLVIADDGSAPATGRQAVRRLVTGDKVDTLIAMTNSAVRDGFINIVTSARLPFVYVTLYEGGMCYPNAFSIGEVPPQYDPVYTNLVKSQGMKNFFLIGHDYVWPQKVLPAAQKTIQAAGGKVVGKELVPFGTTDFGSMIDKIKSSGADTMLVALVGSDFGAFVKQWHASGLDKSVKLVSLTMTDDFMQSLGADAKGIYASFGYFNGSKTPQNTAFTAAYKKAYPKAFAQNTLTEGTYDAVYAYAKAVEAAKSTNSAAVSKALAGLSLPNSPRGPLTIQKSTHHVASTMYLLQADGAGHFKLIKQFPRISPGPQCKL